MNEAFKVTPAPQLTPLSNTHPAFAAFWTFPSSYTKIQSLGHGLFLQRS